MSATFASWGGLREDSVLDRLDGRTRVVAALAVVGEAVALRQPLALTALLVVVLGLAAIGRVGLGEIGHRLLHVEGFLAVLVVLLPFSVAGDAVISLGPFTASDAGIRHAVLVVLRVNVAALAVLTLIAGMEPVRLGHALARLGMPRRLVHLLLFALRYVDLLRAEAARLHDAMRTRAFARRTSRHTLRTLGHFAGQMLVRSLERAERVDEAMRCRGFAGRFALVVGETFSRRDLGFVVLVSIGLTAALVVEHFA